MESGVVRAAEISLPKRTKRSLAASEENSKALQSLSADDLLIPMSSNFETVDGLTTGGIIINSSLGEEHSVSHSELSKVLELLPDNDNFQLYFAVPSSRFDTFPKQSSVDSNWKIIKNIPTGKRVTRVRQYVVRVDFGLRSKLSPRLFI